MGARSTWEELVFVYTTSTGAMDRREVEVFRPGPTVGLERPPEPEPREQATEPNRRGVKWEKNEF